MQEVPETRPLVHQHKAIPTYKVVVVPREPYIMYNAKNKSYFGLCIDMLDEVAKYIGFHYTIRNASGTEPRHIPRFGIYNETKGKWTGAVFDLKERHADIAVGTFSLMKERETVIDMTIPWHEKVGVSVIIKRHKAKTKFWRFAKVLQWDVWLCIWGGYLTTSLVVYICDHYSPYSYQNNQLKMINDNEKRIFTLRESLWFSLTSMTPQGGGVAPRCFSARLGAATWWLFGFIITASFTANLAAQLTIARLDSYLQSLDDLTRQYRVQYSPVRDTPALLYYQRLYQIEDRFY